MEICCLKTLSPVQLQQFGQIDDCSPVENFLGLSLKHIRSLKIKHDDAGNEEVKIVYIDNILSLCVCVCIDDTMYVCDLPNNCEINM